MGGLAYYGKIIIICISLNHIINAETQHKRSPLGFQGVRGKRSFISPKESLLSATSATKLLNNLNNNNLGSESFENILPNDDVTITLSPYVSENEDEDGISSSDLQNQHFFEGFSDITSYSKRAPMGFMGMRGKKDSEYTDYHNFPLSVELKDIKDENFLLNYPLRYYTGKRAPSGFMGMRGKKLYQNGNYYDDLKRAPSGFMGMRGKKEKFENENLFDENYPDLNLLNELLIKYYNQLKENEIDESNDNSDEFNVFNKRAPTGFFGMRGKKSSKEQQTNRDQNKDDNNKFIWRDGYMGMRGKKSVNMDYGYAENQLIPIAVQGVRRKKDVSNVISSTELEDISFKRAPAAGFFGMRGKKQPMGSGFFGMRGKKGPYQFRDKFVGVRGKKVPVGSLYGPQGRLRSKQFINDNFETQDELIPAHIVNGFVEAEKRVPNGFYGVRGKKWTDSSSNEN